MVRDTDPPTAPPPLDEVESSSDSDGSTDSDADGIEVNEDEVID